MLINYADSPIVANGAGGRAPDASGLTRAAVGGPLRLYFLLGSREHTTLLYARQDTTAADVASGAGRRRRRGGRTRPHGRISDRCAGSPDVGATVLPLVRDSGGEFARMYSTTGPSMYVVRPDGYLGYAAPNIGIDALVQHLRATFG